MKNASKIIVFLLSLMLFSLNCQAGDLKSDALYQIATKHVGTASLLVSVAEEIKDPDLAEGLIGQAISVLPDCFTLYLITEKFTREGSEECKKAVVDLLSNFTKEQILLGFNSYLNPEIIKRSTYKWPIEDYSLNEFNRDFVAFCKLKAHAKK